ncbi:MAG: flagellar M-ring protein FliF [Fibromonadaceae bacterium]|jgi:flagellar M-ring protein FliF|nr:flagellar M-ring protein FliF [Fibromonadaceae bacterium]
MSEFFRQLLTQFRDIWQRFNPVQKAILGSALVLMMAVIIVGISLQAVSSTDSGMATLFVNIDPGEAADVTAFLQENKYEYRMTNNDRSILVKRENIHEVRMSLARVGLPKARGKGYELFDESQFGMTDFVQNVNYRRAVEGELVRTIETFHEIERARIHINIPKKTLFEERREEPSASVIVMLRSGGDLQDRQVRGIQHLVASSIEGLRARQVTVLDAEGNMLTRGYADSPEAELTNHNMELKRSTESYLKRQIFSILDGVLGPNKATVAVSADLDFDLISRTVESYNPARRVVRSEQRDEGTRANIPPEGGNETKDASITNYEIDRTVAQIRSSPGNIKRVTATVFVDGIYERESNSDQRVYKPRSEEDITILAQAVKNAIGFAQERNDSVYVASMQFDRSYWQEERSQMEQDNFMDFLSKMLLYGTIVLIVILGFIFLRKVAISLIDAMNPPVPRYKEISIESETEDIPEPVRKQNELIDKLEAWATANPENAANLLKLWLAEGAETHSTSSKKKK